MPKKAEFEIKEVATEMDAERVLDLWGQDFRFDHPKGIAEWIKNSMDAYTRFDVPDVERHIILSFDDSLEGEQAISCVDFVGTTKSKIEADFKKWGSAAAAGGGTGKKTLGGHGNGGKFYMRQMFKRADFITYKDGRLNIFGFNEKKRYGFAEGYQDQKMSLKEALRIARIEERVIPRDVLKKLEKDKVGFTVVRGYEPAPTSGKRASSLSGAKYCERLRNHPQLMRMLPRIHFSVYQNNQPLYERLLPDELQPYKDFEQPLETEIPATIPYASKDDDGSVDMSMGKYGPGKLVLRVSDQALDGQKYGELNRIDIQGEIAVIASYSLQELGVKNFPQASHIRGEITGCEILESDEHDCVKNDRIKLADNELTRALLTWAADQVESLALKLADQQKKETEEVQKKISTKYNEFLNAWKDRLMKKIIGEVLGSERGGTQPDGASSGTRGKELTAPLSPIEFKFPTADVPLNVRYPLTVKVLSPDPIPVGIVMELKMSTDLIELESSTVILDADDLKTSTEGKSVAVINVYVLGRRLDAKGTLTAQAGPYEASIDLKVVSASEVGGSRGEKPQTVLLSGHDIDPLGLANPTLYLSARDYVVYQRKQDTQEGIYWINTANPMAKKIVEKYGAESLQWRTFLFNRYLEIFQKDVLFAFEKRDPDNFHASNVDQVLNDLLRKVLSLAAEDLGAFLTEETLQTSSLALNEETLSE